MKIVCENLAIGYSNTVLHKNINFTVSSGSYVCVIGGNGVGKSTLMKTILGLISPIEGNYFIEDPTKKGIIGYLPQQSQLQKEFPASVEEVVLSGLLNRKKFQFWFTNKDKEDAKEVLHKLGIQDLMKKSYSKLSGGQQQKVLLARALCATNNILLLDEPTAGLDTKTTKDFYEIIKKLNEEGVTIMMITHKLDEVIEDASQIICIDKHQLVCMTKDEYINGVQNG